MNASAKILGVVGLFLLWVATVVPVRVFDDEQFEDQTTVVASLASHPAAIGYLLLCVAATVLLVMLWSRPSSRRWAVSLVIVGVLAALLVTRPGAGDILMWDGADSQGRPTGGMARMIPAVGMWLGVAGGLLTAAVGAVVAALARVTREG